MAQPHVLVVGAGLSGLACARRLHAAGLSVEVREAADAVGGRVRTDEVEGFRLDRGFQVLLSAYPESKAFFDYDELDLQSFYGGALVYYAARFHRVADPGRHPGAAFSTLTSGVGSLLDKARILRMRRAVLQGDLDTIWERDEMTTLEALRTRWGFSDAMVSRFFRPFLGGITLDLELSASSRVLEFVFRMFSSGPTTVPALGMGRLPEQLAAALPEGAIRLGERVAAVEPSRLTLHDGSTAAADAVVVAADGPSAGQLLGLPPAAPGRRVTCLYYVTEHAPVDEPILMLDGVGAGPAVNVVVMSRVSRAYAPSGSELVSVSVVGRDDWSEDELDRAVRAQMRTWFGDGPLTWRLLKSYRIRYALPDQRPPALSPARRPARIEKGLYVCGDHRTDGSINGALLSGRLAAEALLDDFS